MGTSYYDVQAFLEGFKVKLDIWGIIFRDDRGKNFQTLLDLDLRPKDRIAILKQIATKDFVEGPIESMLYKRINMWVFGKQVKGEEVYIKISIGPENESTLCISFHIAEHGLNYPFRNLEAQ